MSDLKTIIETAFDNRDSISPSSVDSTVKGAVTDALAMLDNGEARVAEKVDGEWKLVTVAFNLKRMWKMIDTQNQAPSPA